jgi:hypothetical protein
VGAPPPSQRPHYRLARRPSVRRGGVAAPPPVGVPPALTTRGAEGGLLHLHLPHLPSIPNSSSARARRQQQRQRPLPLLPPGRARTLSGAVASASASPSTTQMHSHNISVSRLALRFCVAAIFKRRRGEEKLEGESPKLPTHPPSPVVLPLSLPFRSSLTPCAQLSVQRSRRSFRRVRGIPTPMSGWRSRECTTRSTH